jgi:hypothetical protein
MARRGRATNWWQLLLTGTVLVVFDFVKLVPVLQGYEISGARIFALGILAVLHVLFVVDFVAWVRRRRAGASAR